MSLSHHYEQQPHLQQRQPASESPGFRRNVEQQLQRQQQAQQQQQQSPQLVLRGSQLVGCADAAAAAEMSLAGAAVGQPTGAGAGARVPFAWTCEQCSDVENTAANLSCANCDTPAGPGRARAQSSARMRIFRARRRVTQAQGTLQHALAPTQPASNFPANPQNKEQHDPPENASALPVSDAAAQGGGGGGCGGGGSGAGAGLAFAVETGGDTTDPTAIDPTAGRDFAMATGGGVVDIFKLNNDPPLVGGGGAAPMPPSTADAVAVASATGAASRAFAAVAGNATVAAAVVIAPFSPQALAGPLLQKQELMVASQLTAIATASRMARVVRLPPATASSHSLPPPPCTRQPQRFNS
ncbi:hypothetical protein T492DRAFT_1041918 [Pavlovales sp. CCMP2436]|nr:hypothetical protein T492DRAFT_1041918 [Pavlovales sp. CCMP2436]